MPRPLRRYTLHFRHAAIAAPIVLPSLGRTPCEAKNRGHELLEAYLKEKADEVPATGWVLSRQTDEGIVRLSRVVLSCRAERRPGHDAIQAARDDEVRGHAAHAD